MSKIEYEESKTSAGYPGSYSMIQEDCKTYKRDSPEPGKRTKMGAELSHPTESLRIILGFLLRRNYTYLSNYCIKKNESAILKKSLGSLIKT